MYILGVSAFYHDSAAALIENGTIVAAAQEERFTRKKHDASFPVHAIKYCLQECGIALKDVEAIVFYDKPFLKFERLLDTYYAFAPRGLRSFMTSMPVWIKEKIFLKRLIRDELKEIQELKTYPLLFSEHHLSHAASSYFVSSYNDAAILTIDGVGEWATASISKGNGRTIEILKELHFPHSLGLLYSAFTYFLGFKVNSGEYKLMGLAPYGNTQSAQTQKYIRIIYDSLVDVKQDGSLWLNQDYFTYATGLRMVPDAKWKDLFGFARRNEGDVIEQHHCDLASAIQQVTEDIVLKMATEAKRLTGSKNICLAGGVALNCVANGKLQRAKIFDNVFIQPASGDAGGALGAALAAYYLHFKKERALKEGADSMNGSYLGPHYTTNEIEKQLKQFKAVGKLCANVHELVTETASLIAQGNVVGWFQGRMEFGPRALGNRTILADPRNEQMQKKLNLKIKFREGFRPFAPAVKYDKASAYFELDAPSPYMLMVAPVKQTYWYPLPENYNSLPMMERLYIQRSSLPAITHVDLSARVQTVHPETNALFYELLNAFEQQTGVPVLVNTSFNVRGEPPVCSPVDAYRCFMRTEMDYLIIGNYIFERSQQPQWNEPDNWKEEFTLD